MVYIKLIHSDVIDGMQSLEDDCIDLIVTSPPYGVGMEYEKNTSQEEYDKLVVESCKEFKRVLKPDGRFAINVPLTMTKKNTSDIGEPHIIRLVMHTWEKAIIDTGLQIRDYIAWDQSNSGMDTCWGSFRSASSPWIRHQIEMIIIGYNSQWKKINKGESTIESREFTRWTVDKWTMPCARSRWHPAVFPKELPTRCIKLFSYIGDTILDPFCGTATTLEVARILDRNAIGIERDEVYCNNIRNSSAFGQMDLDNSVEYIYEVL